MRVEILKPFSVTLTFHLLLHHHHDTTVSRSTMRSLCRGVDNRLTYASEMLTRRRPRRDEPKKCEVSICLT
jgi:hypothetical protein